MLNKEIPEYIVMEKSLVGNEIHEAGAKVPYDGLPADNLKPTCALGEKRRQEYIESNAERVRKMKEQFTESGVGDPTKFMAAFVEQMKQDNAERDEKMAVMVGSAVVQAMAAFFPNGVPGATAPAAPAGKGKDKAGESLV